jgi:hypothetical protein
MQITECLADIQKWREDRKKIQKEYDEQDKILEAKNVEEIKMHSQKLQKEEERIKKEQDRLDKLQATLIKNATDRISNLINNSTQKETKIKADAFTEMLDSMLNKNKYKQLDESNTERLMSDVVTLRENEKKYDTQQKIEPINVDEKYLKAMDEIYKMQADLENLSQSVPAFPRQDTAEEETETNAETKALIAGIEHEFDDIDKIFSELGLPSSPPSHPNPQEEC